VSFPSSIQRWARVLQKRFGFQGYLPLSVSDTVTPTMDLASTNPVENLYTRGETLWGGGFLQAAVVGQYASVRLENGPQSNSLVVVERFTVYNPVGGAGCNVGIVPSVFIMTGGTYTQRDSRMSNQVATARSNARIAGGNAAGALILDGFALHVASWDAPAPMYEWPFVIAPGAALYFESSVVNSNLGVSFIWREVPLAPGELISG
jgi:hypothetical protein